MPIEANLSQILARRVMAAATLGDWPLVKSLADVLINLQERDLVTEAGRAAWAHERVREVPLINPPMREDKLSEAAPCSSPMPNRPHIRCAAPPGHMGEHETPLWHWPNAASAETPRRCSAKSGTAQCQLAAGHDGGHGYRSPTGAVAAWD